jgi:hypothetical protein
MRFSLFLPIMERMESLQEVVFPDISGKVDAPLILMRRLKRVAFYAKNVQASPLNYSPSMLSAGSNLEALAVKVGIMMTRHNLLSGLLDQHRLH